MADVGDVEAGTRNVGVAYERGMHIVQWRLVHVESVTALDDHPEHGDRIGDIAEVHVFPNMLLIGC